MVLGTIDFVVIGLFILALIFIGVYFKKIAEKNKSEYLLGGNHLPWHMLGLSNASGMFDISGTMWLVTLMFVYGLKSIWIPWLWPTFNQIFLMMFLSSWLRKSNVTTGAEWIGTRFGKGMGSKLSHGVVVIFALIVGLSMLAYGFVGLGKFLMLFIPWEFLCNSFGISPDVIPAQYIPHAYGILFTLFATFYAIMGGMVSIVWADVLQYAIMTVAALIIGIIAMQQVTPGVFDNLVPNGWGNPFFSSHLDIDWSQKIKEVNDKISEDGYSLFSLFFGFMFMKGILVSLAGPAPTYDMQKILATKNPKEAMKMSGFVSVALNPVRYFMIAGFAVLAIVNYDKLNLVVGDNIDFEQILPSAMVEFVPAGLLGLLLAGLLAAFMSTFAGTLNAAQAYVSNDIYLNYINPKANEKQIRKANHMVGVLVVVVSTMLGFVLANVNEILQVVTGAFYASYIASNVLKWYWWRLNGEGYFWGMFTGILSGLVVGIIQLFSPEVITSHFDFMSGNLIGLYLFPVILVISLAGCILGTMLTQPTEKAVLISFYKTIRPWGFWKPILSEIQKTEPEFKKNTRVTKDLINVAIGIVAQTALVVLPIVIVVKYWVGLGVCISLILVTGFILKKTWWDKLDEI